MPRAIETKESQMLRWFRTAPLAAATLLLGLVESAVRERRAGTAGGGRRTNPRAAVSGAPAAAAAAPPPKAAQRSRKKAKARKQRLPGAALPTAVVDEYEERRN